MSDVARELGIRWKNAPAELKTKYEQAASEKKHVYQTEMAAYKHQASNGSSPPETPQTPLTPHDYQAAYSAASVHAQQQHPQLQQLLLQQQQHSFSTYDNGDTSENPHEFDLLADDNPVDDGED